MNCESLSETHPIEHSAISQCSGYSMNGLSDTPSLELRRLMHVRGSEAFKSHSVIRLMLLGNSGSGKSSFVQFMSGYKNKISPVSRTARVRVKGVGRLFDMIEAPGFQCGAGEGVWHETVAHSNQCGGVDVFLLILNAMEEDAVGVYRELNNFERKYVSNRQLFWERAVVVFTHADSKGSTQSEREKNIQILLHDFNADKLREIVINVDNRCLYVNSLDHTSTYQAVQLQSLYNQINKMQEPYPEDLLLQSVVSMNDYNPMTTFGSSLSHHIDYMNNGFEEFQTIMKKKKKKKKILNMNRIMEITKLRRHSRETDEELSIEKYKNTTRRRSSLKFVVNPLKRMLSHNRQGSRDFERTHSDQSVQRSIHECQVPEKLNRSSTLPNISKLEKDESVIKENLHAIDMYEQNEESQNLHNNIPQFLEHTTVISEQLIFTVISDRSDSDEEAFYTPPQSLSEI